MDRVEFEPEEIEVAMRWHGGQSSMLYAMASTGHLARGAERSRPRLECEECSGTGWLGKPSDACAACGGSRFVRSTDEQWLECLALQLLGEALECVNHALMDELWEDVEHIEGIAAKCRVTINQLRELIMHVVAPGITSAC